MFLLITSDNGKCSVAIRANRRYGYISIANRIRWKVTPYSYTELGTHGWRNERRPKERTIQQSTEIEKERYRERGRES